MSSISSRIISCCRIVNVASSSCSSPCSFASCSRSASVFAAIALLSASGDSGILPSISGMKITWPVGAL